MAKTRPSKQQILDLRSKQQPLCLVKIDCNQWSAGDSVWWLHCYGIITSSHESMTPNPVEPCCILKKVAISGHFGPSLHVTLDSLLKHASDPQNENNKVSRKSNPYVDCKPIPNSQYFKDIQRRYLLWDYVGENSLPLSLSGRSF